MTGAGFQSLQSWVGRDGHVWGGRHGLYKYDGPGQPEAM